MIKMSMQFREHEETQDPNEVIAWLKRDIVPRLLEIPGVAYTEVTQSSPFSFLLDKEFKVRYVAQLEIFYNSEEDFHTANANFNDEFLVQEVIRTEPYNDIHICFIEKIGKKQGLTRKLFGNWDK